MIAVNKYVNQQHLLHYSLDEQLIHGMRVSNLAYQVAKELGEPEEFCHDLAVAGMLHDIGKKHHIFKSLVLCFGCKITTKFPKNNGFQILWPKPSSSMTRPVIFCWAIWPFHKA